MADLNYTVDINTKGARNSLKSLTGALGALGVALGTGQVIQFADSITSLKNRLATLQPVTKSYSDRLASVNNQFKVLVAIANAARSPLEQTGDLFFRIARASQNLGVSAEEAGEITLTLARALSASGISAQEAAGPLLQLGQALQSGRFQGDELRSVLEGLPVVANELAKELGVPIGQLRKLGAEGKITAQVFVSAMQKATEDIKRQFESTMPTISQSFTILGNTSKLAFDEIEKNSQVGKNFAIAIELLAMQLYNASKNIDEFIKPLKFFFNLVLFAANFFLISKAVKGLAVILKEGATAVKLFAGGMATLWGGLKTFVQAIPGAFKTGMGQIKTALSSVGTTFTKFGQSIRAFKNKVVAFFSGTAKEGSTWGGAFSQLFKDIGGRLVWFKDGIVALGNGFKSILAPAGAFAAKLGEIKNFLGAGAAAVASFLGIDALVDSFNELGTSTDVAEDLRNFREELAGMTSQLDQTVPVVNDVVTATAEQALAIRQSADAYHLQTQRMLENLKLKNDLIGKTDEEKRIAEALAAERERFADEEKRLLDEIAQARATGTDEELATIPLLEAELTKLRDSYSETETKVIDLIKAESQLTNAYNLQQFALQQNIDLQNQLIALQDSAAKMTLTTLEQKYYDIDAAAKAAAKSAIEAEEARRGEPLSAEEIAQYYETAAKGAQQLKDETKNAYDISRDFDTGWQQALNDFVENATDSAAQAKAIFSTFTKGIEDAFVNFVKTGKLSFKDLIMSMIEMIVRSKIQQLLGTLFGLGGGGGGGVGGFFKSIFGLAEGGPAQGGRPYIVGEKGPELFVPKTSGTVVPNDQMGMGSVTNNNTYVTNQISAVDAKSVAQLFVENRQLLLGSVQMAQKERP